MERRCPKSGGKVFSKEQVEQGLLYPVAQLVTKLPAMQETWVRSLDWGKSPGEGNGYPLQYSGLENSMDCIVHGVTKSWTQLSDFHFHIHFPEEHLDHFQVWATVNEAAINIYMQVFV